MKCWEVRGCDEEMWSRCPHFTSSTDGLCPNECRYTICDRATRAIATDFNLLLDPTVDRTVTVKEACLHCSFFLKKAPRA